MGYTCALSASPTRFSSSSAFADASSFVNNFNFTGASIIFSLTVIFGNRLNCWNTIPIFSRSAFSSLAPCRPAFLEMSSIKSLPSNKMLPLSGCSNKFKERRNVDFPHPEGPIMAITSPFDIVVLIPSWRRLSQTLNVFWLMMVLQMGVQQFVMNMRKRTIELR